MVPLTISVESRVGVESTYRRLGPLTQSVSISPRVVVAIHHFQHRTHRSRCTPPHIGTMPIQLCKSHYGMGPATVSFVFDHPERLPVCVAATPCSTWHGLRPNVFQPMLQLAAAPFPRRRPRQTTLRMNDEKSRAMHRITDSTSRSQSLERFPCATTHHQGQHWPNR